MTICHEVLYALKGTTKNRTLTSNEIALIVCGSSDKCSREIVGRALTKLKKRKRILRIPDMRKGLTYLYYLPPPAP